jgi:hypothetical protein
MLASRAMSMTTIGIATIAAAASAAITTISEITPTTKIAPVRVLTSLVGCRGHG